MPKPTDIRIVSVSHDHETLPYRTPIKFGGRVVTDAVLWNVTIEVETRDGRRARGYGSMPMGNAWAWPSKVCNGEQTLAAMIELAKRLAKHYQSLTDFGHPLELVHTLSADYARLAREAATAQGLSETIPPLAALVSASPYDAAVHDGFGRALGANAYDLLGSEFANAELSHYLTGEFAGEFLDRYTLRTPKPSMPLYHLVGALDPLSYGDLAERVNDNLPETLSEWIATDGLRRLKIKLAGDDLAWDVARVVAIEKVAAQTQLELGVSEWLYSCDFNEKCANVEYVLDFLAKVREQSPAAFDRIQYIEQPTHRNLKDHPENRMHRAAEVKPVVIDESLVDLESLRLAREQGYTGVALKACKGHTEALLMGAAAQKYGMFLCVQDLTCPGFSFLHSASLAARIPTIAAIEGNSRQYCPAGNIAWGKRYPEMFHITDGTVGTRVLVEEGLGFGP